jgi:lipopolysaccharide/colanic/teichoic acid biosynthesis glycosyltransferase
VSRPPTPTTLPPNRLVRRGIDVAAAAVGLVALSPVLLLVALAIGLGSSGGILFRQVRVGRFGRPFTLLKFRTMTRSSDGRACFPPQGEDRTTPFGHWLRRTRLDELPQLWNVLRGDMSLVGPRPEVPDWVDLEDPRWIEMLSVRPGLTDPASLAFLDEAELLSASDDPEATYRDQILPAKLDRSVEHLRTRTLRRDLEVLWQTVVATISRTAIRSSRIGREVPASKTAVRA